MVDAPATKYKFNDFHEIKSHSSILYNERMAILFYLLDMKGINMNTYYDIESTMEFRGILLQIYKNIRTLIYNNPTMRSTMNLDTKDPGIYVTDVGFGLIDKMVEFCETNGYTTRNIFILIGELNKLEMIIKNILQYYSYFIRPDFKQKPDVEIATEKYKEIADERTVNELRELVGKRHKIDFESLGVKNIDFKQVSGNDPEEELLLENNDEEPIKEYGTLSNEESEDDIEEDEDKDK